MGGKESKPEIPQEPTKPETPLIHRRRLLEEFDPRSPSCGIDRTPIQIVKNKTVLDPRSPTVDIVRTPIVVDKTWHKVSASEIQKQIEEYEKDTSVAEVNLNNTGHSSSPDKASTSNKEQLVVEAFKISKRSLAVSPQTSASVEKESNEVTPEVVPENTAEIVFEEPVLLGDEEKEEEVKPVVTETAPSSTIATGGLEMINTPEYEAEIRHMKKRSMSLPVEPSDDDKAAVMTIAAADTTNTRNALQPRPRRGSDVRPVSRCTAVMSSPQRSPLSIINASSSPKVLWQRKASTNIPLNRTPQGQMRNKRSSAGNTPARMVDLIVDKENM